MKLRSIQILTVLSLVAGATRVATAAEPSSPWSLSISGGDSLDEQGSLRTPRTTDFTDLGALDPSLSGTSGTLRLDKLNYEDLFRRRFDTGLELDYSFDENLQTFGRLGYTSFIWQDEHDRPARQCGVHFARGGARALGGRRQHVIRARLALLLHHGF